MPTVLYFNDPEKDDIEETSSLIIRLSPSYQLHRFIYYLHSATKAPYGMYNFTFLPTIRQSVPFTIVGHALRVLVTAHGGCAVQRRLPVEIVASRLNIAPHSLRLRVRYGN